MSNCIICHFKSRETTAEDMGLALLACSLNDYFGTIDYMVSKLCLNHKKHIEVLLEGLKKVKL